MRQLQISARFCNILTACLAISTALNFAGGWTWWMDLFSHFRVHYAAAAALLAAVTLWVGSRRWAAFAVFLLVVNGYGWAKLSVTPTARAEHTLAKALVFNVNSNGDPRAVSALLAKNQDADLVGLLEITSAWLPELNAALAPWPHRVVHPRGDNFGLLLASRWPLDGRVTYPAEVGLPAIEATVKRPGTTPFGFVLVHTPPPYDARSTNERDRMIVALTQIRGLPRDRVIAGDFNATPWSRGLQPLLGEGLRWLGQGHGARVTWPDGLGPLGIYIDHAFVTGELQPVDFDVLDSAGSDHFPLLFSVGRPSEKPRP